MIHCKCLKFLAAAIVIASSWADIGLRGQPAGALPHVPENVKPPIETVHTQSKEEADRLEKAIAPYVAKARAELPEVRKRFAKGLLRDQILMFTIRLTDLDGKKFEQIFVQVEEWNDKEVKGTIVSELLDLKTHKTGDSITFGPADILDWTILNEDGTEEGNRVGKFLETYK